MARRANQERLGRWAREDTLGPQDPLESRDCQGQRERKGTREILARMEFLGKTVRQA